MFELIDLFPIFFFLMFAVVFVTIIVTAVKMVRDNRKENPTQEREVEAQVVSRRTQASDTAHQEDVPTVDMACYVTFRLKSGEQVEFQVSDAAYSQLAEGASGTLTFRGSRYLGFARAAEEES